MRTTLTISTGNRNYTVQGEPDRIDKLFDRLVQATFVPVTQPMYLGVDLSNASDMTSESGAPADKHPTQKEVEVPNSEKKEIADTAVSTPEIPADEPVSEPDPVTPETKAAPVSEPTEETSDEPRKYRGFLIVKCKHCGHVKGFMSKNDISYYRCECGKTTDLVDLVPLTALCECGKRWRYMTNLTEDSFELNCIHCGSPIPVFWNGKLGKYETLFENTPKHKKGGKKK